MLGYKPTTFAVTKIAFSGNETKFHVFIHIYIYIYMKRGNKNIYENEMRSFSNETLNFSSESSVPPTFWFFPKLYELWESSRRNLQETLK